MKKLLTVLAILFGLIFVLMFDYFYYPMLNFKAKSATEQYLEEKYKEDFTVDQSSYSKPLGENGLYSVDAHPAKDPSIFVRATLTEDMKVLDDSYTENTWRAQLNKEFGEFYVKRFGEAEPFSYAVNLGLPSHIHEKYDISNSYQEIFKKDHKEMSHIVFMNTLKDPEKEVDSETQKLFELIMDLKEKDLFSFTVDVNYYGEDFQKDLSDRDVELSYFDFRDEHRSEAIGYFSFAFTSNIPESVERLNSIKAPEDLKEFFRRPNK